MVEELAEDVVDPVSNEMDSPLRFVSGSGLMTRTDKRMNRSSL